MLGYMHLKRFGPWVWQPTPSFSWFCTNSSTEHAHFGAQNVRKGGTMRPTDKHINYTESEIYMSGGTHCKAHS